MRFEDLEGGPAIFADPTEIASRYLAAVRDYLAQIRQIVLESVVDYHQVKLDENYEQVLMRFLVGRTRGKGAR
jgi:hypothetical protein